MKAELLLDCQNALGEGLFHDAAAGQLWWVDIPMPSKLHRLELASGAHRSWEMPEMISYAVPRASGGLLVAGHGGLSSFDPADGGLKRIRQLEDRPFNRSNDACCDASGRLWVGTMQNNFAPDRSAIAIVGGSGALYRVDHGLAVELMLDGIEIPNACCFSPDGRTMYFCDTPQNMIRAYDIDPASGALGPARDFATHGRGGPDGATVDADGGVWNARYGGGCVVRFAPDGSEDQVVEVPASQVTCCGFGGPELDTLYITTARNGLTPAQLAAEPHAGGLFAVKPGRKGLADQRFGG